MPTAMSGIPIKKTINRLTLFAAPSEIPMGFLIMQQARKRGLKP
jgi:hypothetical protein